MAYEKPAEYPRNPTTGWMRSELERHGLRSRGDGFDDKKLTTMLRLLGYEIRDQQAGKAGDVSDR